MLRRQDHDRRQIGDDQHDVLRDLRPGHRPHAAEHRAQQDADKAGEHRDLELHAEEARGDEAGAVNLRRHVGEGAAHQHDHGEEAREVAAEAERHEVGHRIGAELAQVRSDQDRHQHEAAGPAEHPGKAVIAEQEQRAGSNTWIISCRRKEYVLLTPKIFGDSAATVDANSAINRPANNVANRNTAFIFHAALSRHHGAVSRSTGTKPVRWIISMISCLIIVTSPSEMVLNWGCTRLFRRPALQRNRFWSSAGNFRT